MTEAEMDATCDLMLALTEQNRRLTRDLEAARERTARLRDQVSSLQGALAGAQTLICAGENSVTAYTGGWDDKRNEAPPPKRINRTDSVSRLIAAWKQRRCQTPA